MNTNGERWGAVQHCTIDSGNCALLNDAMYFGRHTDSNQRNKCGCPMSEQAA